MISLLEKNCSYYFVKITYHLTLTTHFQFMKDVSFIVVVHLTLTLVSYSMLAAKQEEYGRT